MKVLIKKRFRDADTSELMFPGQYAEYTPERARRLARGCFVQILEEEPAVSSEVVNEGSGLTLKDEIEESVSEKSEKTAEEIEPEKVDNTTHIAKAETTDKIPKGKPGRKPKK